ncbi:hypothetical protein [[Mycobacterium] crassicus]|uniref:PPE family protein n=1 Tax=[Mycobacterium] crassicus TaxID=2872309 RepID=A0ABU5XP87_9MYCO|nr:hypothetical protein [Mycolicibacter sp. MYC098]MEB3024019.1 hypothetical protein [Mycolicibacter sp. MYC098]
MQLTIRPMVPLGVAVIGAGLIQVTPLAAPTAGNRGVELAAAVDSIDLVSPVDALVTGAWTAGVGVSTDALGSELPNPADMDLPTYLDPQFWQAVWGELTTGDVVGVWYMLINAGAEIPLIGPIFSFLGIASFLLPFLLAPFLPHSAEFSGLEANPAAADGVGVLGDSAAHDVDTGAVMSILDPGATGDLGTAFDPAGVAGIATLPDTSPIPDLDGVLTSLVP